MKTDTNNFELDADLLALIEGEKPLNEREIEEHAAAVRALENDPEYIALSLKADVVTEIYHAMQEEDLTPSKLARKWGKSRQYLSKILSEDKRINFTVDTIAEIMAVLNRKVEMHFPRKGEYTMVIPCLRQEPIRPAWQMPSPPRETRPSSFEPTEHQPLREEICLDVA